MSFNQVIEALNLFLNAISIIVIFLGLIIPYKNSLKLSDKQKK